MAGPPKLAQEQLRTLDRLSESAEIGGYYLAGGSAVALHLAHRISLDLDFFSIDPNADLERIERVLEGSFSSFQVVTKTDVAAHFLADGARLDFVRYPYAPLDPPVRNHGVAVASLRDLGAMKLAAIARRGIRRDFWDLFEIVRHGGETLEQLGQAYVLRFGVRETDLYHVLKALTYFDDAERDPALPLGLTIAKWEEIKVFFRAEAPNLVIPGR